MYDIQFLLNEGVIYNKELYDELYEFWIKYKGREGKYRRSDLTLNSKNFFDNAIEANKHPDMLHDKIHLLLNPIPMYTKILKDGCEVETCEIKFNNLSLNEKIKLIEEEVMVMAYERFRDKHYKVAYDMMMERFITGHAPVWQLIFIIENFKNLRLPSFNYYKKIETNKNNIICKN